MGASRFLTPDASIQRETQVMKLSAYVSAIRSLRPAIAAVTLACLATSGIAQVNVQISLPGIVQITPPPVILEPVPVARSGMVWVPGQWRWAGQQHVWQTGYWVETRPDAVYVPGRWRQVQGGWRWDEPNWRMTRVHDDRDDDDDHKHKHKHKGKHKDKDKGRGHEHGHGVHCPPGQAKKGNC